MFNLFQSSKSLLDVNCKNADGLTPLLLVTRDLNLFEKSKRLNTLYKNIATVHVHSVPVNKLKYALVHVHVAKYIILTFIVIINSDVFLIIIK